MVPETSAAAGAATRKTLEDCTLRFEPCSYRKWTTGVLAISALGGIASLADFAIGANIGISYGTGNALLGILVFAVIIFATGVLRRFGAGIKPYSPIVAVVLALVLPPAPAIATKGKYYLRRTDDGIALPMVDEYGNPSGEHMTCHVCRADYEPPDMTACRTHDDYVGSLCLSTDKVGDHLLPATG